MVKLMNIQDVIQYVVYVICLLKLPVILLIASNDFSSVSYQQQPMQDEDAVSKSCNRQRFILLMADNRAVKSQK